MARIDADGNIADDPAAGYASGGSDDDDGDYDDVENEPTTETGPPGPESSYDSGGTSGSTDGSDGSSGGDGDSLPDPSTPQGPTGGADGGGWSGGADDDDDDSDTTTDDGGGGGYASPGDVGALDPPSVDDPPEPTTPQGPTGPQTDETVGTDTSDSGNGGSGSSGGDPTDPETPQGPPGSSDGAPGDSTLPDDFVPSDGGDKTTQPPSKNNDQTSTDPISNVNIDSTYSEGTVASEIESKTGLERGEDFTVTYDGGSYDVSYTDQYQDRQREQQKQQVVEQVDEQYPRFHLTGEDVSVKQTTNESGQTVLTASLTDQASEMVTERQAANRFNVPVTAVEVTEDGGKKSLSFTEKGQKIVAERNQDLRAAAAAATSGSGELARNTDATDFTAFQDEIAQIEQQVESQNPGSNAGEDFRVGINQSGAFTVNEIQNQAPETRYGDGDRGVLDELPSVDSGRTGANNQTAIDGLPGSSLSADDLPDGPSRVTGQNDGGGEGLVTAGEGLADFGGDIWDAADGPADWAAGSTDEWVSGAEVSESIGDAATSGGFSQLPGPDIDFQQLSREYTRTVENTDLGARIVTSDTPFGEVPIGVAPGLRQDATGETDSLGDNLSEGALKAVNPPGMVQAAEDFAEAADNPGVFVRNPGQTGEAAVAWGRDAATGTVAAARQRPEEFAGGAILGLASSGAGAASALRGSGSVTRALASEVDPRVGPFGATIETKVARAGRNKLQDARSRLSDAGTSSGNLEEFLEDDRGSMPLGSFGTRGSDTSGDADTSSDTVTLDESTIADETATADVNDGQLAVPPEGVSGVDRDPVKQGLNEQGAFVGSNTRSQDPAFGGTGKPDRRPDRDFSDALSGGGVVDRDTNTGRDVQLSSSVESGVLQTLFGTAALSQASEQEVFARNRQDSQNEASTLDVGLSGSLTESGDLFTPETQVDSVTVGAIRGDLDGAGQPVDTPQSTREDQPADIDTDQPVRFDQPTDVRQPTRTDQPTNIDTDQPIDVDQPTRTDQPTRVDQPGNPDRRDPPRRDWPDLDRRNNDPDNPWDRDFDFRDNDPFAQRQQQERGRERDWTFGTGIPEAEDLFSGGGDAFGSQQERETSRGQERRRSDRGQQARSNQRDIRRRQQQDGQGEDEQAGLGSDDSVFVEDGENVFGGGDGIF